MPSQKDQNEIMSDEVHEIVSYRPGFIIRNGNFIFLLVLILFSAFAWFIKYPDIIKGSMKLSAINAPKLLVAKTEGKLERLLVSNDQNVSSDQPLAFLQSTADAKQVLVLQKWITHAEAFIVKDSLELLLKYPLPFLDQLGEVQPQYQSFQNTLKETLQILGNGYYRLKGKALTKDLQDLSVIQTNTEQQQELLKQDFDLQQKEFKANETLVKEKVITPLEFNQNKSKLINKEQGLKQIAEQIASNEMTAHNKQMEILDLQKSISDERQKFRSELFNLKSKVGAWIQQYIIIAPENGKVLFSSFLQENQLLSQGQELFYIQPPQSSYYGQLTVAQAGLGKIKPGQRVIARVASYPSSEFGYLTGVVGHISNMPTDKDSFLIRVDLPNGMKTNYNRTIYFRNSLIADAEIMTDSRKLFDRIFGQLKDLTKR